MPIIRPATEADLTAIHHIFYLNEVQGDPNPPPPGAPVAEARHILQTGTMVIAQQDREVIGYAGSITRSRVRYLTDLFVHPEAQSGGLGKALLQQGLQEDDLIGCTMSSTDPRTQSLSIRSGMQPQWPHFNLRWHGPLRAGLPNSPIEVLVGEATDPEVIVWDAQIGGRERSQDHAFWQGTLLWLRRRGVPIGSGYVRTGMSSFWDRDLCRIGPIGVRSPEDASEGVRALVEWASARANRVRIDVPGPHPA
jgi:GNAT superfamily N-acetyltransferase